MKKLGFTLAEVLLAVAILGVVAAVTIGVLRNVIPEDYTYTSKKASVTLSEGVKTILEDDKKYPSKEFKNGEKFCTERNSVKTTQTCLRWEQTLTVRRTSL